MPRKQSHWLMALDAWLESNQAVLDAVKRGNERAFRFSMRLVGEAERGQQEIARLSQRFGGASKNRPSPYREGLDLARRTADHSAELAEEFISATDEVGRELRETATAIIRANRTAAQAMVASLEGVVSDLGLAKRRRPRRAPSRRKTATRQAIERTVEQAAAASNGSDGQRSR